MNKKANLSSARKMEMTEFIERIKHAHPGFVMGMADLSGNHETAEDWAGLCELASVLTRNHSISASFDARYQMISSNSVEVEEAVQLDMYDNYLLAGFSAIRTNLPRHLPLIAWAAANKSCWEGLHNEIALVRTLLWGGFDVNATDQYQCTALHHFAVLHHGDGCHPRAIELLLQAGCNPNITNYRGDTALMRLSANVLWNKSCTAAWRALLEAGTDPRVVSLDGASVRSLLNQGQAKYPDPQRQILISELDKKGVL